MTTETTHTPPPTRAAKSARLEVRVSLDQKRLFEEAAALTEQTVSEFVTSSAQSAAQTILSDRTRFVLPPERWAAFAEAIVRPPRDLPRLAGLLSQPSVLDAE